MAERARAPHRRRRGPHAGAGRGRRVGEPALRRRDQSLPPRPGAGLARRAPRRLARPGPAATRTATAQIQIYRSTLDGAREGLPHLRARRARTRCRSCSRAGDWILFHSWNGHTAKVGGPGFGGLGSDVWVMTRDGTPAHQPDPERRVPRQLPRLLVARRPLHRLDGAQLERGRGRQRQVGRPRRALRSATARTARAWSASTSSAPATATGTRRSGGRPTARASSTPRPSTRRSTPSSSSAACPIPRAATASRCG